MWKIYVFDMDLADVEYVAGGWQLYLETSDEKYAKDTFATLEIAHEDNVCLLSPEEELDDYANDMYAVHSNAPCDTYGPAACSSSCSNYPKCMGWVR